MIANWNEFRAMALQMAEMGYVPIFGEFNDQLEEVVVECIFKAKSKGLKTITLLINSGGGYNSCFATIKATMLESGLEYRGLVMGKACSNAFNLLQVCDKRIAVRDAYLMFHWGWQKINNHELTALIAGEIWVIETAIEKELMTAEQVSKRTGISVEDLKNYAQFERYFTAPQSLVLNFIDEITEDLPVKVREAINKSGSQVSRKK